MTSWISYSILIPLFPIIIALIVGSLIGESVDLESLLGGTDLFMLSIVLLATTRNAIEGAPKSQDSSGNFRRVATLLVPAMLLCSALYGTVFMDVLSDDPNMPKASVARLGLTLGISTFLVCGWLQHRLRHGSSTDG